MWEHAEGMLMGIFLKDNVKETDTNNKGFKLVFRKQKKYVSKSNKAELM